MQAAARGLLGLRIARAFVLRAPTLARTLGVAADAAPAPVGTLIGNMMSGCQVDQ